MSILGKLYYFRMLLLVPSLIKERRICRYMSHSINEAALLPSHSLPNLQKTTTLPPLSAPCGISCICGLKGGQKSLNLFLNVSHVSVYLSNSYSACSNLLICPHFLLYTIKRKNIMIAHPLIIINTIRAIHTVIIKVWFKYVILLIPVKSFL